jgi:hypothetical protein
MTANALKSIGAGLAGILVSALPAVGTDALMHAVGIFPPLGQPMSDGLFLLPTIYRTVFGVAGGYLTARLAPNRPMLHALTVGALGVAVAILGTVLTWNKGPEFGPHWYPLALVVLGMPQSWLGAKLRLLQTPAHCEVPSKPAPTA